MHRTGVSPLIPRLARDGYIALAIGFILLRLFQVPPWDQSVDAYAYWATRDGDLYDGQLAGAMGAYVYSPVFAQLVAPLTLVPWPLFVALWTALNMAVLWWLVGRWSLLALLLVPVSFEIVSGNVHLLYAAAIVLAVRGPLPWTAATWALSIVTKVTPAVGLLWHLVRREWGALAVAAGVTAGLVAVSWLLDPPAWQAWVQVLGSSSSTPETVGWFLPVPLLFRLPLAVVISVIAGATGRAWLLPVAVTAALPVIWLNSLAILVACVPLRDWERSRRPVTVPGDTGTGAARVAES